MRYLAAFALLGFYVVWMSTLEPDTGRWFAIPLSLLGVAYVVSAMAATGGSRR